MVARDLLGRVLWMGRPGDDLALRITETEAYLAVDDRASHSFRGPTARNAPMFGPPGRAYVYLIYGIHHCLNAVTEAEGVGAAVLIRGVEGVRGPGLVCRAYGLNLSHNGLDLSTSELRILPGAPVPDTDVLTGPRVGITRSAHLPLRFRWAAHVPRPRRARTAPQPPEE